MILILGLIMLRKIVYKHTKQYFSEHRRKNTVLLQEQNKKSDEVVI